MTRVLLALALVGVLATPVFAYTSPGAPTGYVNDFAKVLSVEKRVALETELTEFEKATSNEVVVVTVPTLGGDYVENYAVKLFEDWKIGKQEKNNGVLLLLAIDDKKLRIEVGYGLEGAFPDSVASSIIRDMTPDLKAGNYDGAVQTGVNGILAATKNEYQAQSSPAASLDANTIISLIVFGIFALQWLLAILSRTKSYWLGGVLGALAGSILSSFLGMWLVQGLVVTGGLILLGLAFDFAVSRAYTDARASGVRPPWWTGGAGGFGTGSGGGFGGFGGGRSGGGGASGGW